MTIYATGNPVGSTSPKDLIDNSQNLDLLILGPLLNYPDRRGVNRLSWAGIEASFAAAQAQRASDFNAAQAQRAADYAASEASRGYENPVPYAAGIDLTRVTQLVQYNSELYKAKAGTLPWTTTGVFATDSAKLVSVGDNALRQELAGKSGYSLIGTPNNLAELRGLPAPSVPAGRTFTIPVAGHTTAYDGGEGYWYWQANSNEDDDNAMVVLPTGYAGVGRWKRSVTDFIRPEMFGCKGDFNWTTQAGTVDTAPMQAALNWCNRKGCVLQLMAGKKYLVDTQYLYYDAVKNPGWTGRAGRVSIIGHANGHATGALEDPGCALVHVNGSASELLDLKGVFNIATPTAMGGYFSLLNLNLVGGNATTNVLRIQGSQGSIMLQNYTVKVQNPAGNGILEATSWETTHINGLIRGGATGLGTWTGAGLYITSDGTDGQTNMKSYTNINSYKMGYGVRISRGSVPTGTLGPLEFTGGQTSNCDYYGLWLGGGVISFTSIGFQQEGARLNGIRIDRTLEDGVSVSNDIARSVKIINTYITGCGTIEDGSVNSYAVYVANGDGVELDTLTFNNMGNGIGFDAGEVDNLLIRRPTVRTVRSYGAASGYGFRAFGTQDASKRIYLERPTFNQNPSVQVDSIAQQVFARGAVGGRISLATNSAAPSISLGGTTASEAVSQLNFNYSSAVTLTNITGGQMFKTLLITFSNTNVTIPNNRSTFFLNGAAFTPSNSKSILVLYFDGTAWNEVHRSQNA